VPLREKIFEEIRRDGPMPFSRYMELCLYHPVEGYYSSARNPFGKGGDFYTASDVCAVFGRLLARQFEEMWLALGKPAEFEIIELGPGRGLFARDVLDWAKKKFPDFYRASTYTLQESSETLRSRLSENLADLIAEGKAAVSQSGNISIGRSMPRDVPLIVFANEFFDALPVEILSTEGKLHLDLVGHALQEVWLPAAAEELEFLDRYGVHPEEGERIELSLAALRWVGAIDKALQRGFFLTFDYGYTGAEQLAGRHRGTLMAYRAHAANPDPYQAPGLQDITAHVNFSALASVSEKRGMRAEPLRTQSQFLMGIGEITQFADVFEECRLPQERAKVALQLKHLINPSGMGETFQVLLASRGVDAPAIAQLSGLRFGGRLD